MDELREASQQMGRRNPAKPFDFAALLAVLARNNLVNDPSSPLIILESESPAWIGGELTRRMRRVGG